jgi:hypothetical protein
MVNMNKIQSIVGNVSVLLLLCAGSVVQAQPSDYKHDLVNCRFYNGIPMPQDECEATRKHFAAKDAKKAEQDAYLAKANAVFEAEQAVKLEEKKRKEAEWAVERVKRKSADEIKQAEYWKMRDEEDHAQAISERKAVSVIKSKCGADYKAPRIGMSIDRVKECVTSVKMTGQLKRADGVITTYEGGNAYFHVMDSRIVSWGKY